VGRTMVLGKEVMNVILGTMWLGKGMMRKCSINYVVGKINDKYKL
jgi:hypothetical protein